MRANPPRQDPRQAAAEVRRKAVEEVKRRFGWRSGVVLWLVRKLQESMAAREGSKGAMVAMMLPMRKLVLEVGRRLVEAGHLDAAGQVLQLSLSDLVCWFAGQWDGRGAGALTLDRAQRRVCWLAEAAPEVITEEPDGRIAPPAPALESTTADGWDGIAISPGSATGWARIVTTPTEAAHLGQGDILVAPSTDPGWTPLFLRAAAIVMETGGYLSHGAIVAREFGIPAVANVPGVLASLKDGETVTVNGTAGRITRGGR